MSTQSQKPEAGPQGGAPAGRAAAGQTQAEESGLPAGGGGITAHSLAPAFDLEAFLLMSGEKRLGAAQLERLAALWPQWLKLLKVRVIKAGKISWLAVWLPGEVEEAVDATWERSASEGFMVNNLAQFMCMRAVQEMLPQVEAAGCAPSPRITESLRESLASLGLPCLKEGALALRYAVLTHYPFRGGCEICHLQAQCPRGQGQAEAASVLLPGYER